MPDTIFISYRRADTKDITARMHDRLEKYFELQDIFRDVDSIPAGVKFSSHLDQVLSRCQVLLAVIGRTWINERLHDEGDHLRRELEFVLHRGIPVIPVLVHGAGMPNASQLPDTLKELVEFQAMTIDSGRLFKANVAYLARSIADRIESVHEKDRKQDVPSHDRKAYSPAGKLIAFSKRSEIKIGFLAFLLVFALLMLVIGTAKKDGHNNPAKTDAATDSETLAATAEHAFPGDMRAAAMTQHSLTPLKRGDTVMPDSVTTSGTRNDLKSDTVAAAKDSTDQAKQAEPEKGGSALVTTGHQVKKIRQRNCPGSNSS